MSLQMIGLADRVMCYPELVVLPAEEVIMSTYKVPACIRKHERDDPMQDTRKLIKFARAASRNAINKQLENGISVVYVKNGNIVEVGADRQERVIKTMKPKKPFNLRAYLCQDSD